MWLSMIAVVDCGMALYVFDIDVDVDVLMLYVRYVTFTWSSLVVLVGSIGFWFRFGLV